MIDMVPRQGCVFARLTVVVRGVLVAGGAGVEDGVGITILIQATGLCPLNPSQADCQEYSEKFTASRIRGAITFYEIVATFLDISLR